MRPALVAVLALLAFSGSPLDPAAATHPCFGPDCGIPHSLPAIKEFAGDVVACLRTPSPPTTACLKEALP